MTKHNYKLVILGELSISKRESQYRGVTRYTDGGWVCRFSYKSLIVCVGYFDDEYEAARVRGIAKAKFLQAVLNGDDAKELATKSLVVVDTNTRFDFRTMFQP